VADEACVPRADRCDAQRLIDASHHGENTMASEALDQINTMVVETRWGDREFRFFRGDITKLNFPVDLMVISSIESDYEPTETSVIGSLYRNREISVAQLSDDPEFTLAQPMKL
jgi:hypothetical protein